MPPLSPWKWIFNFLTLVISRAYALSTRYQLFSIYISAVLSSFIVFYTFISLVISSLFLIFPSPYLSLVTPILPTNLKFCLTVVLSVRFASLGLEWGVKIKDKLLDAALTRNGV